MKFTKTAVALAIAGMAAAPMIASADTTLSGAVQLRINGNDGDNGDARISVGDVLVGVSTSHELNSGLTGYGSLRIDLDRLSNAGTVVVSVPPGTDPDGGTAASEDEEFRIGSAGTADSVFVGIKGAFGDIRIGEVPNAVEMGQLAADIHDVAGEVNGGISYTGGFGPATILAQFSPELNSDVVGVGIKFALGGFNFGIGGENRGDDSSVAAGVSFSFSGASIAAQTWTKEDDTNVAVKVGYGFGGVSAGLTFSTLDADGVDSEAVRLDLGYGLGGGMDISARVDSVSGDTIADASSWRIQLSKTF